ncbi:MAG: avidin/streptavidin family protein [Acidimicrobiales bacterium]
MFLETILADAVHLEGGPRRPPSTIAGRWRNRLGSTMELDVGEDHRLHGTYHSGVGVPDTSATFVVAGFAEGDAVAFTVDFGRWGSVAAWAGHHVADDNGERLVTLWHLAQPVRSAHGEADVWGSLMAGSDEFTRVDG